MPIRSKKFVFTSYEFLPEEKKILFNYKIEFADQEDLTFTETIVLPEIPKMDKIPEKLIQNLLQSVHLILGTSYFKLYFPPEIEVSYPLSTEQAEFWNKVYRHGFGEFMYRNQLNPERIAKFPSYPNYKVKSFGLARSGSALVGIGGGKDSIVTVELLKASGQKIDGFVVETQKPTAIISNVVKEMGLNLVTVQRFLDPKIFQKFEGSYNGHIPISAVFAFLSVLTAVLYGYDYMVVSNEYSSNFGNVEYEGDTINHQWSKSAEFESLFQNYIREFITPSIVYFSALRPFYEMRIVEMFSHYKQYFPYFSSCNQSYLVNEARPESLWCGKCPKCAFIFALLSAFLPKDEVIGIFGKNLFADQELLPLYTDLLGFGELKPFDCVGTFEESQAALYLAREKFKDDFIVKELLPRINNPESKVASVMKTNPAPTVPSIFRFLGMKKVAILGYGGEGKSAEEYLAKFRPNLQLGIVDQKYNPDYLTEQKEYDLAIKTPGMPPRLVEIPYTTTVNIFFAVARENGNRIVAITGSKGKSTTTYLVFDILKAAGFDVELLGNMRRPFLLAIMNPVPKERIFVLELSSYMLNNLDMSPNVAVVTNLFPEHMDWHGSEEAYYAAKKNIINYQNNDDYFIYNQNNSRLKGWADEARSIVMPFADSIPVNDEEIPLLGNHNRENIKAAIAAVRVFNVDDEVIARAVKNFQPLRHRLQKVGEYKSITFYDDAISTTPESTMAALAAIPNVKTIFLGGQDRGYDFTELEKDIRARGIENVVLFPDSGSRIFSTREGLNILETANMEEAVKFAYKVTPTGSVCLLSTASPSYSVWKDFEEKGDEFQKCVKELGN